MARTIVQDNDRSTIDTERVGSFMNMCFTDGDEGSEGMGTTIVDIRG